MRKKIFAMLAAGALCVGMLPTCVFADAEETAGETVAAEAYTAMSAIEEEAENDTISFDAETEKENAEVIEEVSDEAEMYIGDFPGINDGTDSDVAEGDLSDGIMTLSDAADDMDPDDEDADHEAECLENMIETYAVLESAVYLDGTSGDDETGDGTDEAPVATFAKAKELAEENSLDVVYITGPVTVTDTETWDGGLTIYRDPDFTDDNLVIVGDNGSLTLTNITIDDDNVSGSRSLIKINGDGAVLTIDDGAVIQNNYNSSNTLSNGDQGAVCVNNGKLVMNAGEIRNNYGHGFGGAVGMVANSPNTAEMEFYGGTISGNKSGNAGGGIYLAGNSAKLTMYGGIVTDNIAVSNGGGIYIGSGAEAYIYAGTISYNKQTVAENYGGGGIYVNSAQAINGVQCSAAHLYIYNVEITENKITTTNEGYLATYNATIGCCETGYVDVNVTDGDVIHDNEEGYTFFVYESDDSEKFTLSPVMLGGGAYNWVDAYGDPLNLDELTFNHAGSFYATTHVSTSDGTVTGLDRCYTRLIGNEAVVMGSAIGTNGYVTIGKEDGDVSIEITKKWDNIPEGDREDIDVCVYATDGSGVTTCIGTVTLSEENEWTTTVEYLPKYDYYGLEYTYTIAETDGYAWSGKVTGGETNCSGSDYNTDEEKTAGYEFTVTNSLTQQLDIFKYATEEDGSEAGLSDAEFVLSKTETDPDGSGEESSNTLYAIFTESDSGYVFTEWTDLEEDATTLTSGEDGYIHLTELLAETYTLTETKAPEGYEIVDETITVVIDGDGNVTASGDTGSKEAVTGHVVNVENSLSEGEDPEPETTPGPEEPGPDSPDTVNPSSGNPDSVNPSSGNPDTGNPTISNPTTSNPTTAKGGKTDDPNHMGRWLVLLIAACALVAGGVTVRTRRVRRG